MASYSSYMKRLYVSEPGFDDVGAVLRGLDLPFAPLGSRSLSDPTNSVIFLNCGGGLDSSSRSLRRFVDDGGTLYASDLQADLVAEAFEEQFRSYSGDEDGRIKLRVMEPACGTFSETRSPLSSTFRRGST